jgi:hypothetical protein
MLGHLRLVVLDAMLNRGSMPRRRCIAFSAPAVSEQIAALEARSPS